MAGFNNFVHYVVYGNGIKEISVNLDSGNDETMVSSTLSEEKEYEEGERVWASSTPRHRGDPGHHLVSEWLQSKVNYVPPPRSTSSRTRLVYINLFLLIQYSIFRFVSVIHPK